MSQARAAQSPKASPCSEADAVHERPDGCFFDQPDASLIRHDGPWRSDAYEFYARQMFEPAPLP